MLKSIDEEGAAQTPAAGETSDRLPEKRSPLHGGGRVLLQIALMIVVLGGSYWLMNWIIETQPERGARSFQPTVYPVETVAVEAASNRPQLLIYGEVQAARSVELRPLVNGEIIAVNPELKAGSHVSEGDVLLEIDTFH